jgi:hypothetical protein
VELMKDMNPTRFDEYEHIILKAVESNKEKSTVLTKFINDFIEAFSTCEEKKKIKDFSYQIEETVNSLYMLKKTLIDDIDISYTYSSHFYTLCTERAKLYYRAIERIEEHYSTQRIAKYIKKYKNF